jgi:hypothetical protein
MASSEAFKMDQDEKVDAEDKNKVSKFPSSFSNRKGKFQRYFRSAIIRVLVGAAIFTLGGLFVFFTLYWPTSQNLSAVSAELGEARLLSQDHELAIAALKTEKGNLEKELTSERLRYALLHLEKEIVDASLAAQDGNFSRASLSIDQAKISLRTLSGLLPSRHAQIGADLQTRLNQAGELAEKDLKSALPELRTLSGDLAKLKENLQLAP